MKTKQQHNRARQEQRASHPKKTTTPAGEHRHVILPEEDFEFWDRGDYIELEYLRVRRLRHKRGRTAKERKYLAKHDAVEARIQSDPKTVLNQAREAIDQGTVLLLKLIRSRKLRHDYPEDSWDDAVECFTSRLGYMNQQFVRLSEDRTPKTCFHLWYQAMNLADAIVRLAAAFPEEFRSMAESSLMMPSLRARNPKFSCDSETIVEVIHLAEKHPARDIHDNRTRIGALCHYLVAEIVEKVQGARREKDSWKFYAENMPSSDGLPLYVHPDHRKHYLESWKLPELHGHADEWWEGRVREMVRYEFDRMRKNPTRNPALWQELEKVTDHGTDSSKRAALDKYCFNKLEQIAGKPALAASPG
jgi:hypothetical protein